MLLLSANVPVLLTSWEPHACAASRSTAIALHCILHWCSHTRSCEQQSLATLLQHAYMKILALCARKHAHRLLQVTCLRRILVCACRSSAQKAVAAAVAAAAMAAAAVAQMLTLHSECQQTALCPYASRLRQSGCAHVALVHGLTLPLS